MNKPIEEQTLVEKLRTRAAIRRSIKDRKSVQEGKPDRIANLLEEAANEIEELKAVISGLCGQIESLHSEIAGEDW